MSQSDWQSECGTLEKERDQGSQPWFWWGHLVNYEKCHLLILDNGMEDANPNCWPVSQETWLFLVLILMINLKQVVRGIGTLILSCTKYYHFLIGCKNEEDHKVKVRASRGRQNGKLIVLRSKLRWFTQYGQCHGFCSTLGSCGLLNPCHL